MDNFESKSFDFDESGQDVRYNLDSFLYDTIMKLGRVFDDSTSAEDGFSKYRHLVEHLQVLAIAAKSIKKEDFDELITKFKDSLSDTLTDSEESLCIAREKLALILAGIEKKSPKKGNVIA